MPEVLQSKTAGQSLSSIWPEVPERHPDTEEVTGSNPVRPTPFFENPSSAESLNGSQPAAVLSDKRWSRRFMLRSTQETFSPAWRAQRRTSSTRHEPSRLGQDDAGRETMALPAQACANPQAPPKLIWVRQHVGVLALGLGPTEPPLTVVDHR